MNGKLKAHENLVWFCAVIAALAMRFMLAYVTSNFDFNSWRITGELAAQSRNVYANTTRYNYGPVWFNILGLLWRTASQFTGSILLYKALIVITITLADFLMARLIAKRAGLIWGVFFMLNPISFSAAGDQTQFDSIAVTLAALGVTYLESSSESPDFTLNDLAGIVMLCLSLMTKHFLWAFPLWLLLNTKINPFKKILYALIPPLVFILSFIPYWPEGHQGIISNVFMYRSMGNFPLIGAGVFQALGMNFTGPFFGVYIVLMSAAGYVFRRYDIFGLYMAYSMAAVCFSSSVYDQYLIIGCMAVIVLFRLRGLPYFVFLVRGIGRLFPPGLRPAVWQMRLTCTVWCLAYYLVSYYRHKERA